ncbi:hypothetical protein VTJ04DRAFT_3558 [Mycothermus thermophilus]|uniref:uncharacterized protein n=1 Tax=Humicola insolens TaxID=85995 RepID=UPI003742321C
MGAWIVSLMDAGREVQVRRRLTPIRHSNRTRGTAGLHDRAPRPVEQRKGRTPSPSTPVAAPGYILCTTSLLQHHSTFRAIPHLNVSRRLLSIPLRHSSLEPFQYSKHTTRRRPDSPEHTPAARQATLAARQSLCGGPRS